MVRAHEKPGFLGSVTIFRGTECDAFVWRGFGRLMTVCDRGLLIREALNQVPLQVRGLGISITAHKMLIIDTMLKMEKLKHEELRY